MQVSVRNTFSAAFCCLVDLCTAVSVRAQQDTINLNAVEIQSSRLERFTAGKPSVVDSIAAAHYLNADIGKLLAAGNELHIKNYGVNGSSVPAMRGTEARHTTVLWNGFSINAATLGLADLSLIPVCFSDRISIYHGAASYINGSASFGGVISLENNSRDKEGMDAFAGFEAASLNNKTLSAGSKYRIKKFTGSTKLFFGRSINDFKFRNTALAGSPLQELPNARSSNFGLLQQAGLLFEKNVSVLFSAWYQVFDRQIPPLMIIPESKAVQKDSILRLMCSVKKSYKRSSAEFRAAWFDEHQFYNDSLYAINASYRVRSLKGEAEWRYHPDEKITVYSGVAVHYHIADIHEYKKQVVHPVLAVFGGSGFVVSPRMKLLANIRLERNAENAAAWSAAPGFEFKAGKNVLWYGSISRNYNFPTLNDLYWQPGGNSQLQPELAWSFESGLKYKSKEKVPLEAACKAYYMPVENWIQWTPGRQGIYMPENLKKVLSRGAEVSAGYSMMVMKVRCKWNISYSFTQSKTIRSENPADSPVLNKQLIYIPRHAASAGLNSSVGKFHLMLLCHFTGKQFTIADHSNFIHSYYLADARLEGHFSRKKLRITPFVEVTNLFNEHYQPVAFRPMPGRNYSAGIHIQFSQN